LSGPGPAPRAIPFGLWWLTKLLHSRPGLFIRLGRFETNLFEERLAEIDIDRPVFIAGLARSGTTITLELLTSIPGVATYRYRDFPGVHLPLAWNRGLGNRAAAPPVERLHGDGILITADSPEALDEPIWMSFFPEAHDPKRCNTLTEAAARPDFDGFYRQTLKKILLLRHGRRLVLKGNYLISRLVYLRHLFPDARFVLLIRHPIEHIGSLLRQQENFSAAASADPRTLDYLRAIGHFEFGADRRPINCGNDEDIKSVVAAWGDGREIEGWALYWRHIYDYLADLLADDEAIRQAALIIRFEDLHSAPETSLAAVLEHCGLGADPALRDALSRRLQRPDSHRSTLDPAAVSRIWEICGATAARFGIAEELPTDH
jgi:Sulfotransferase family